jgi:hypothetical protein
MTDERVAKLLACLREGASITSACMQAGVARRTATEWRSSDPEFSEAFEESYAIGVEVLEKEAYRRAVDGNERPVFQRGVQIGTERQFSDSLLMFLLKARDPRFRDKATVEMTGKDGGPVQTEGIDLSKLSIDERRSILAAAARATIKAA